MELGKFMYQLYNNKLFVIFTECFNKIKNVHDYLTGQSKNLTYFLLRVNKSITHFVLGFRGIKHCNTIESSIKDRHWVFFKKQFKRCLINKY